MLIIEIILLLWVFYNLWIVINSLNNAVTVGADATTNCSQELAFKQYLNIKDYYLKLSKAHIKYELSGQNLLKDVVIDIWEKAGFQLVKHKYRVTQLVPNEKMKLISENSRVTVFGIFKGQSKSETEFNFIPLSSKSTTISLRISIIFPNKFRHLLARVFFTQQIWQIHAKEETLALAKIIEQRVNASTKKV